MLIVKTWFCEMSTSNVPVIVCIKPDNFILPVRFDSCMSSTCFEFTRFDKSATDYKSMYLLWDCFLSMNNTKRRLARVSVISDEDEMGPILLDYCFTM